MDIIKFIICILIEIVIYIIAKSIANTFLSGAVAGIIVQTLWIFMFKEN